MTQHSLKRMVMNKAAKYGAIAGSIATWTISTAVAGSELELGLPIGSFYSIIGISLGLDGNTAPYLGFGLHILTGTILGAAIGAIAIRLSIRSMLKSTERHINWHRWRCSSLVNIISTDNSVVSSSSN